MAKEAKQVAFFKQLRILNPAIYVIRLKVSVITWSCV